MTLFYGVFAKLHKSYPLGKCAPRVHVIINLSSECLVVHSPDFYATRNIARKATAYVYLSSPKVSFESIPTTRINVFSFLLDGSRTENIIL